MFDYEAARKDGYSDEDIQKATGVDIAKIRNDGYGDLEIASAFKSYKPYSQFPKTEKATVSADKPKEPSFLDKLTSAFHEDTHDTTPLTTQQKLDKAKIQYQLGRRSKEYIDNLERQVKSEQYAQHNKEKMDTRLAQQAFTKQSVSQQLQQELLDKPLRALKSTEKGLATLPALLVGEKTAQTIGSLFGDEDKYTKAYPHLAAAENIVLDPSMIGAKIGVGEDVIKGIVAKQKPIIQAVKEGTLHPQRAEEILKTDPTIKSFTDIVAENINKEQPKTILDKVDEKLVDMGHEPEFKKPLSPQAQAVKDVSEIPVGGSEDATAQAVKQAFVKQPDSVYKKMNQAERDAYDANYQQSLQHGEVKGGEPLDDYGQPLFSKGEDITPEQRIINRDEWHKDSHPITKDADGTPKTFYHGSPVDIKEFKPDEDGFTYVTENPEYAGRYVEKNGKSNGIYPVNVKANKIFDTRNPKDKAIFEKEFYRKYGNGTPLDSRTGLPDWTEAGDMKEFFADKGYKYDGVMFAETLDQKGTGASLAIMKPENIKSIHNRGTFDETNPNILMSKGAQGSTTTESIHQSAKKLLGKNYNNLKGDINIVQSYKDLPKDLLDRSEQFSSGGKVRGVFDPKSGKVHLVADTMGEKEVNGVLVHELLHKAKANGEKILGEAHDTFVLRLKQLKNEPLVKQAFQAAKYAGTSVKHMDEEMMSYLVEKYQLGKEMSPRLKRFVSDIIDAVKVFASKTAVKLGVDSKWLISKMNEKDIAALLKSSAIKQEVKKVSKKAKPMYSKASEAVDKVTEHIQDYWKPAEKYLKGVEGEKVNDARKLIFGRVGTRIEQVKAAQQIITDDIVNYGKKAGEEVETLRKDLNAFLIAQHAPERNAALKDGAAGITTQAALDSLDALKKANPQKYKFFEQISTNIRRLNEQTLRILLDGQVITQDLYDTLRNKYKMHVPLQRVMPEDVNMADGITVGKGLSVKSSGIKAAKGSDLEVSDILSNVSANVQEAIIRAEKNRVGLAMDKLFESEPQLGKVRGLKMVGKDFNDMPIMETPTNDMIVFFKEGKKKVIEPNDPILAQVYNQLNVAEKGIVADIIAPITRTLAGLYTRLNPEFAFSNVIRDLQEAMIYNASTMGGKEAVGALSKQAQAMNGVRNAVFGDGKSEWAKLYLQMKEDGGTTGGITLATRTKITQDVDDAFKIAESKPRQAVEKVFESIDNFNTVFEDGTRLAAYKQALDQGLSRERAAVIAKETTIDFNRKGAQTPWLNALYMFSNASIQGSYKMIRALKNPKVLAATVGLITAASISNDAHNDSIDPNWRDKVSDFERGSNFVILLDSKDGKLRRIDIPVGWGIKPIKVMVDTLHDKAVGKAKGNSALKVAKAIAGGYNPLGGNSLLQSAVPTIGDVATDIMTNTSFSGSSITPKGSELADPSKRYYPETPETFGGRLAIKFVQGIEEIGIDLTPEDVKYIVKSYGGGPLNFSTGVYNMLDQAIHGEYMKEEDRVMMRRFYKVSDPERLDKYMGSQAIKAMVKKVQDAKTQQERIDIIREELPKIPNAQKKQAINAVRYGGLLPNRKNVIQARDEAQWEKDIFAPFKSTKTKQNESK